ncbi:MAG: sugar-binding protein [Polyangiaceae bacterium]
MKALTLRAASGALVIALGLPLVACEHSEPPKETKLFVDALPKDARGLDVDFDGQLKLVGYKLNTKGPLRPGRNASVTLYWRADKKLEPGLRLASRLTDGAGETVATLDDGSPLRAQRDGRLLHGPETWEPGKLYIDELSFNVPKEVSSTKVQLVASVAKAEQRLRVAHGPMLDSTSALVLAAGTGFRPRVVVTPPPSLRVDRLDPKEKIKLDGKLDEAAWQGAPGGSFVDTATGKPSAQFPISGSFRLLWSKEGFYVGAELKEKDIVGSFKPDQKDPPLWLKDSLELIVDPDGDGDNIDYYEILIGPQNLVYDTHYDTLNEPHKDPDGPFGHEAWTAGVKSAVVVQGTIDKKEDQDEGYVIEALIPWKAFKAKTLPPAVGDTWRINVYALRDARGVGWSPILGKGTLHQASRFGRVLWAEKGYVEPASPAPAGSAEPPKPAADPSSAPEAAPKSAAPQGAGSTRSAVPIGAKH